MRFFISLALVFLFAVTSIHNSSLAFSHSADSMSELTEFAQKNVPCPESEAQHCSDLQYCHHVCSHSVLSITNYDCSLVPHLIRGILFLSELEFIPTSFPSSVFRPPIFLS